MKKLLIALAVINAFLSPSALAGVDIHAKVERVWMKGDDRLWFKVNSSTINNYCKPSWYSFNLYIKTTDKDFPYYYGLITSALAKGQTITLANISTFDGTTSCDIGQTGYGIAVHAL